MMVADALGSRMFNRQRIATWNVYHLFMACIKGAFLPSLTPKPV